ncbi:tripartite ATP-independent transporter solute receptor, DctP family [Desulfonatronum thiosulfatophilum]|uniref:Tripartite ATP-independent transporter solute receptor, DctP family n=1 Tax=Desulfonatronum thiosulfatophilum TaxID=617002 RepID=A0A1G6BA05_9BACT|nr:DctP family TRAP transporter solute-binding subunit [Desulfonatronum thiosulfatophilum]SDB17468.1 tripartite ATP-independent transporter solute receptor, DctP family [Desulfonatronum thiosulfatophilum]
MRLSTKFFALALAPVMALALVLGTAPQAAAQKSIKLHHLNNDDPFDNATGAMATVFKSLVEAGTNGQIRVQTFPNGQLGKDNEVLQQVRAGVIEMGIHSVGGFASIYPMMGIIDVPFAFPDIAATYEVFDGPFGQKFAADMEAKTGMKILGFGDSGGFFHFTNSRKAITTPDDMKGLKIRTMTLDTHQAMINALGAQPAPIAWAELYTALQTGVADGQMNPVPIIAFARFNEVQKYLSLTGHLFAPYVWAVNMKFWDTLSPEEQTIVQNAARSAIVAGRGISRIIEASDRGLPALSRNMEVNALTPEQKAAFQAQAMPAVKQVIADKHGDEGVAMMNAFLEAIEQAGN